MTTADVSSITNTWIACPDPRPQARVRLFCFPYAGGGTAGFHAWSRTLPPDIELCSFRLPGREGRLKEAPYRQLLPLVEAIAEALLPFLEKPFALFGHSMGALLCFELARELRRRHVAGPAHLFVSGHNAPHLPDPNPPLHDLPDALFAEGIRNRYDGFPAAIWQNTELMRLFLPTLRADFTLFETYAYTEEPPLDAPISAFGGRQDCLTSQKQLAAWRDQTRGAFCLRLFPGGHFFFQDAQKSLLQAIASDLARFVRQPPRRERTVPTSLREDERRGIG